MDRNSNIILHRFIRFALAVTVFCALMNSVVQPTVSAHAFMNSNIKLAMRQHDVQATVEIPLPELGRALKSDTSTVSPKNFNTREPVFRSYLLQHFQPESTSGEKWDVRYNRSQLSSARGPKSEKYAIFVANMTLSPPPDTNIRHFNIGYDAVVESIADHATFVTLIEDWQTGVRPDNTTQLGVLQYDFSIEKVRPVIVDLADKSLFTGFVGMVKLGIEHIRYGTDHIVFLLALLIPAPLALAGKRWGSFDGYRASFKKIVHISIAFTIGHSLTLILATLTKLHIPQQPVEALIAVSILISAAHALRPIFPGREVIVAGAFGLIHGAAFSFVLAEMELNTLQLVASLLGFNIGIELMQLIVVLLVLPPLIVFAKTAPYRYIRVGGACLAIVIAAGWLLSRLGVDNIISTYADQSARYTPLFVAVVIVAALVSLNRYCNTDPEMTEEG